MNGIDRITARVIADAEAEAASRCAAAEQRAAEIRRRADDEAAELSAKIIAEGRAEAERASSLVFSAAETEAKKAMLAMKQDLVSEAFDLAVKKLCSLDTEKYVSLLSALAANACETGAEEIILNEQDRARCGDAVVAEANRLSGKSMTLSARTRPIVGGLILSQGHIEVNCAFDTLAAMRKNELSGEAAKLLFM